MPDDSFPLNRRAVMGGLAAAALGAGTRTARAA
ncbi:MAG: hypothetical protein JWP20_576, partial [Roseomonas sp.]|nr:hypothetical protein [Roseomonas sp.]